MNLIHVAFLLSVLSLSNASPMQAIRDLLRRPSGAHRQPSITEELLQESPEGVSGKEELIYAVIFKPLSTVQQLLKSPRIHRGAITDETLTHAVNRGQPGVVVLEALLDSDKFAEDVSGKQALINAVSKHLDTVQLLLDSPRIPRGVITDEALFQAARYSHSGVLEALLKSDKLAKGVSGQRAFDYAAKNGRKAAAMALLKSKLGETLIITKGMTSATKQNGEKLGGRRRRR
jgi:ankyrin repeat protein